MSRSVASDLKAGAMEALIGNPNFSGFVPATSIYSGSVPSAPQLPYASMECKPLDKLFASGVSDTKQPYVDKQMLTVHVWAGDATPEETVARIARIVDEILGNESWTVPDATLMAVYPGDAMQEEDTTQSGDIVWRADVPFEVWLQRNLAS